MSHCPLIFTPQATAWPSLRRSTVCSLPAEIWLYDTPSSKGGMLHCPSSFFPQATADPSLLSSTVWAPPAETRMYDAEPIEVLGRSGMLHLPKSFLPQANARPSLRSTTVWCAPAETSLYHTPGTSRGISHCRRSFLPQATAWPSFRSSTVWQPPAEIWMYDFPSSNGGMAHCPSPLFPHATARPSLRSNTVCAPPADTLVYDTPGSNVGTSQRPPPLCPQVRAWPSLCRSTEWYLPAAMAGRKGRLFRAETVKSLDHPWPGDKKWRFSYIHGPSMSKKQDFFSICNLWTCHIIVYPHITFQEYRISHGDRRKTPHRAQLQPRLWVTPPRINWGELSHTYEKKTGWCKQKTFRNLVCYPSIPYGSLWEWPSIASDHKGLSIGPRLLVKCLLLWNLLWNIPSISYLKKEKHV